MTIKIVTIFKNLEPIHFTKDVGIFSAGFSKFLGPETSSVIYYSQPNNIYPPETISHFVTSQNIRANSKIYFYLKAIGRLIADRVDVVMLYHMTKHSFLLITAMFFLRKKIYLKLDMDIDLALKIEASWAKRFRFKAFLQKKILRCVDCISCEDIEVFNILKRINLGGERLILIPNCMLSDTVPVPVNLMPKRENIFLVVGRLGAYQKNIEYLLSALNKIPVGKFTWKIILLGTATAEFLKTFELFLLGRPDYIGRVELGGFFNRNDLFEIYNNSMAFLSTSRFEGFSLAALEAAWMGCFIVSTPVGGASQLTNDWKLGRMIDGENADDLAGVLMNICDDLDPLVNDVNLRVNYIHKNFDISPAMFNIVKTLKI